MDRDDASLLTFQPLRDLGGHPIVQMRIPRQQPQCQHGMGLSAAHGLAEFEHRLRGLTVKTLQSFAQQPFHSLRDEVPREELLGGVFGFEQKVGQVLDLLGEREVDRCGIELTQFLYRRDALIGHRFLPH